MSRAPLPIPLSLAAITVTAAVALACTACSGASGTAPTASGSASSTRATPIPSTTPGSGSTPEGNFTAVPDPSRTAVDPDPATLPAVALITYAGWDASSAAITASGLVSGTTDASGTCTLLAVDGTASASTTTAPSSSASSLSCGSMSIPRAQLAAGTWTLTLKYTIGAKSVTSKTQTVEVPDA